MAKRNVYAKIAAMFDVALDEQFKIYESDVDGVSGYYKFTEENGLVYCATPEDETATWVKAEEVEQGILGGKIAVLNNWTPEKNEVYYFISDSAGTIHKRAFSDVLTVDVLNAKFHNCFKTKDVAESQIAFIVKRIFGIDNTTDNTNTDNTNNTSDDSNTDTEPTDGE